MPATTGGRPSSGTTRSGYRRPRTRTRRASASQGHPSQGRPTVGGGTRSRPTRYRSPTPSIYRQRHHPGGHPSRGRPTVGGGTRGHRLGVYVPSAQPGDPPKVIPLRLWRELMRQNRRASQRYARLHGFASYGALAGVSRLRPIVPGTREASVFGIGSSDIGRVLSRKLIGAQTPLGGTVRGFGELAKPAGRDLVTLPQNVVVGGYLTGRAAVKAAGGDTREARGLWESFKNTDPVALGVQGRFGEAAKQASEHPLLALLEVAGPVRGVSRGAGRLVPRGRTDRAVEGTRIREVRREPRGLVGRGGRRVLDRARGGRGVPGVYRGSARLHQLADEAERRGEIPKADDLRREALRRDPGRVPDRQIEHQVDVIAEGLTQSIRRPHRSQAAREARGALGIRRGRGPQGGEAVGLFAQNIAKATPDDLKAYLRQLDEERPRLDPAKAKANGRMAAQIRRVLGGKGDLAQLERAARDYAVVANRTERELIAARMLDSEEATRAKLKGYAVRYMGARDDGQRLVDSQGRALSTGRIKAHMRRNGVDPEGTAFVSQRPSRSGDSAFNVSSRRAQGVNRKRRTGAAVSQGLLDLHPDRLVEQVVRSRGLVDANNSWKRFISHFSYRENGRLALRKDKPRAEALARDLEASTGREWSVVRVVPWQGRREQLAQVVRDADVEGYTAGGGHPVSEALEAAAKGEGVEGPWAVVPRVASQRMVEHAQVYRATGPLPRFVTQAFRKTVLPLSTSWLTGNAIEGAVRTAIAGAGPRSWLKFRREYNRLAVGDPSIRQALRRLPEPKPGSEAEQLLHMVPGGHYGGSHETMVRVSARQFEGKALEPVAQAMHRLYEKPGPGTLARAYRAYTDWMFGTFNSGIEAQFTRAMAGKFMLTHTRESRRSMERAVEQGAMGKFDTPEQVAMADFVRRAYGQYDALPPSARRWVLTYTPFGMWTFNAAKFLYAVLPADHPMLTAVLAANHQLTEDWRKSHGLDQYAQGAVPPFLQGSIPLPGGGHLRVARYTPFGLMADPMSTVATNVLPQFSGPLMAFRGLDWKGDPLRGSDGKEVTDPLALAAIGAREFAFSSVPGIGLALRTLQKGPRQTFDPFRPIQPSKKQQEQKDPVDKALDDALQAPDVDKAIDDALKGISLDAGGAEGSRQRAFFGAYVTKHRDEWARAEARRAKQGVRGYRNWLKTPQSRYHGDRMAGGIKPDDLPYYNDQWMLRNSRGNFRYRRI